MREKSWASSISLAEATIFRWNWVCCFVTKVDRYISRISFRWRSIRRRAIACLAVEEVDFSLDEHALFVMPCIMYISADQSSIVEGVQSLVVQRHRRLMCRIASRTVHLSESIKPNTGNVRVWGAKNLAHPKYLAYFSISRPFEDIVMFFFIACHSVATGPAHVTDSCIIFVARESRGDMGMRARCFWGR